MIDYGAIERKWQAEWDKAKIFEGDVNEKKSILVTAAFPYPNSPLHIGHLRTFGTADVLARYKRMQGINVLYPMAFHATGTPILAFAKRIANKDPDLIRELKMFHVPDEEIAKMTDPLYIANYFIKEIEAGMHLAGYSIDWRRKFISIEPLFSKFVEWQFGVLNARGALTKGKHPVGWCPNENNAVGMHDTKHDVEPEIEKESSIRFKIENEDAYFLCTTFRPETISAVTNLFVNDKISYALCSINGVKYYISKASVDALKYQMKIDIVSECSGKDLLAKSSRNPVTNELLPTLPGFFVKEDVGTGIVMSVPGHAPFDYIALQRLKASGYKMPDIKPIKVIEVNVGTTLSETEKKKMKEIVHVDIPALAYLEALNTDMDSADDLIEFATKLEYKEESHLGKMTAKGYEGLSEPTAREKIKAELAAKGDAFEIYVLTNSPVYCRCGYKVVVKVVDDQWFINYGDKKWKEDTKVAFDKVRVLPDKSRRAFDSAIDWIDLRAVVRAQGLGTKFPIDNKYIIESLSDSTIYMSFYTVVNLVRGIDPEKLKPSFFDYVFLGKGDGDAISKETGIDYEVIAKSKESFEYWYVNTSRHSGPDLIFNHLTMYLYNHVKIFDEKYWPKQIVVNGSVLSEGEKMSKSLGNIVPLSEAIEKYGADPLRFVIIAGADLFSDSEFSADAVNGVKERLEYIYGMASKLNEYNAGELRHIDYWLYSKLNRKIINVTRAMDMLELRSASTEILYNSILDLKKYAVRGGNNAVVIKDYLSAIVLMLSPIAPHVAEEMWRLLGGYDFASIEKWPDVDNSLISDKIEKEEELVDSIVADARQVLEIVKKKSGKQPKEIKIIVADDWKRAMARVFVKNKNPGAIMDDLKANKIEELAGYKLDNQAVIDYLTTLLKRRDFKPSELTQEDEANLLNEAKRYIGTTLGCEVVVEKESESQSQRAKRSSPEKPSIDAT